MKEEDEKKLIDDLKNNSNLKPDVKKLLTYSKQTYDLLKVISKKISHNDSVTLDNIAKNIQRYSIDDVFKELTNIEIKLNDLADKKLETQPTFDYKPSQTIFSQSLSLADSLLAFGMKQDALAKYLALINLQTDKRISSYLYNTLSEFYSPHTSISIKFNGIGKILHFESSDKKTNDYNLQALELWPQNLDALENRIDLEISNTIEIANKKNEDPKLHDYLGAMGYINKGISLCETEKTDPLEFYEYRFDIYGQCSQNDLILTEATLIYEKDKKYFLYLYYIGDSDMKTGNYSEAESNLKLVYDKEKTDKSLAVKDRTYPQKDNTTLILKDIIVTEVLLNHLDLAKFYINEGLTLFSNNKLQHDKFSNSLSKLTAANFNIKNSIQNVDWNNKEEVANRTRFYLFESH